MNFSLEFSTRDFSAPIFTGLNEQILRLDWSAEGGPAQAHIRLTGAGDKLIEAYRLLRCPVMVRDKAGTPVWWGYVEDVVVYLEGARISVSLAGLYNKVSVRYSFISPNNGIADQACTDIAEDIVSQEEYGVKEITLQRYGIDDDFALNLRDTFLKGAALPRSALSQNQPGKQDRVVLKCAGWFKSLAWQSYQNLEGFYANPGPGPGVFNFGQSSSTRYPSQVFTPGADSVLQYAYFQLRGIGNPTRNLNAQLRDAGGNLLATSDLVAGSALSSTAYRWVKFTFTTPYAIAGGTTYMLGVTANTVDPSRYFAIRSDENQSYENGYALYFNGSSWVNLPSVTNPGGALDLIFRAVCIADTGSQIEEIANAGSQFFTRITAPVSSVMTCPYRDNGEDCLKEIQNLMALGTANHRRILARVTPERQLEFFEQPDPDTPSVYMDGRGQFWTFQGTPLKAYFPPVGQFARYSGSSSILLPFDKVRIPACFIEGASYYPQSGRLRIRTSL
ncbi:MAG: hypothetical protein SCH68_09075 [Brevefilum sp.]|nr:hypothetical protein [Brevefilum sp.]